MMTRRNSGSAFIANLCCLLLLSLMLQAVNSSEAGVAATGSTNNDGDLAAMKLELERLRKQLKGKEEALDKFHKQEQEKTLKVMGRYAPEPYMCPLQIEIQSLFTSKQRGKTLEFEVIVMNTGRSTLKNVAAVVTLPPSVIESSHSVTTRNLTYFKDGEHLWKWKGVRVPRGDRGKMRFLLQAQLSKTASPQFFYVEASAFIYADNRTVSCQVNSHPLEVYLYDATALNAWPLKISPNGTCPTPRSRIYAATQDDCKDQCRLEKGKYNIVEIWGSRGPFTCVCTQKTSSKDKSEVGSSENATKSHIHSLSK